MCERRAEMKAPSYEMDVLQHFPSTIMELGVHESRCEEHENDSSVRHKYLNLKRSNIDMAESVIQFWHPCPLSFSLVSQVASTIMAKL